MTPRELVVGDVVQLSPDMGPTFGGCFALVTEPKSWGMQGFVAMLQSDKQPPAEAYIRATWENMEYVGRASWVPSDEEASQEAPASFILRREDGGGVERVVVTCAKCGQVVAAADPQGLPAHACEPVTGEA